MGRFFLACVVIKFRLGDRFGSHERILHNAPAYPADTVASPGRVAAHGGDIGLASDLGLGRTFGFELLSARRFRG